MTRHDTLVKLKPGNPFESVLHLFEDRLIPTRDPWGMLTGRTKDGKSISLFCIDKDRVTNEQRDAIASILAEAYDVPVASILQEADKDGLAFSYQWIEAIYGGAECYRRTIELIDFLELEDRTGVAMSKFIAQQYRDWIDGDKIPELMPDDYGDIDPRLKSPELEQVYRFNQAFVDFQSKNLFF